MMRIIIWQQHTQPPEDSAPGAVVGAFNELEGALRKVSGAGDAHWGFGHGGLSPSVTMTTTLSRTMS